MEENGKLRLKNDIKNALAGKLLKKAVFSKPKNSEIIKSVATPFEKDNKIQIKFETFTKDGKDRTEIISENEAETLADKADFYSQINLVGNGKNEEILISKKGKFHFTGCMEGAYSVVFLSSPDRKKRYILTPENDGGFLYHLGITDKNGQIHDKKQSKYRQINKFLEQIETVKDKLPKNDTLCICDLCCGKSYLTFAAYWYFTEVMGRKTEMFGVDLKKDVIAYCTETAKKLGFDGLHFSCGDVSTFTPPRTPDMVLSLHACDIATDYVLAGAVRSGAKIILSTPCCQHEFNTQMHSETLGFITDYSILKQKLASAATDALRAKMLEIHGYNVTVCELIDPEETPKNTLIRAFKTTKKTDISALCKEYRDACNLLSVYPTLEKLLPLPDGN